MKVVGVYGVKVNDVELRVKHGSAKLMVGGFNREPVMANGRVVGYQEEPVPSELEATLVHTADVSLRDLADLVDATVVVTTDVGVSYLINGAFTTEPVETTNGEIPLKMSGSPAIPL